MGVIRKLSEISENIGNNTADFLDKVAEEVREFSCELWEFYPDQISQNKSIGASFSRGFMNNMCRDKTLPPAPIPPFTGGQCIGISYQVTVQNKAYNIDSCALVINNTVTYTVIGAIEGIAIVTVEPNQTETSCNGLSDSSVNLVNWILKSASPDIVTITNGYIDGLGIANPPLSESIITNIVRTDGQPDTCGNPGSGYPPTDPTPSDYTKTVAILSEDNDTLNFQLTYNPSDNNFPLNFDFGGIDININIDGIEFDYSPRDDNNVPEPLPDGQQPPLPTPPDDPRRFFRRRRTLPPNSQDFNEEVKTPEDPKTEETGQALRFVKVTLTSFPSNARSQDGGSADNVIYAGWFEFKSQLNNFNRVPIHFENCVFEAPEGATGYAYTLYNGFIGFATVYNSKE